MASFSRARPPQTGPMPNLAEDDDDDISITSTLSSQHDSDEEWFVEDVLAEEVRPNVTTGIVEPHLLIRWDGYKMHSWTWEPKAGQSEELRKLWKTRKTEYAKGSRKPFDTALWRQAVEDFARQKYQRHVRRNAKRAKNGLAATFRDGDPLPEGHSDNGDDVYDDSGHQTADSSSDASFDNDLDVAPQTETLPVKVTGTTGTDPSPVDATVSRASIEDANQVKSKQVSSSSRGSPTPPLRLGYQRSGRKPSAATKAPTSVPEAEPPLKRGPGRLKGSLNKPTHGATGMTAKKSGKSSQAIGNVFTSGKSRRQRRTLGELMSDPSQNPKHFNKMRIVRKAELRSREKADKAPDILPAGLFQISKGPETAALRTKAVQTVPALGQQASNTQAKTAEKTAPKNTTKKKNPSLQISTKTPASVSDNAENGKPKKRKSVRWAEDNDIDMVESPMDLEEDSLFVGGGSTAVKSPVIAPDSQSPAIATEAESTERRAGMAVSTYQEPKLALRKLSLNAYHQARPPTHPVDKTVVFGPTGSSPVRVTFDSVAKESKWALLFASEDVIAFTHKCTAKDFISQGQSIRTEATNMSSGSLKPITSETKLEDTAARLRIGALGVVCHRQDYAILVYPTKCEDWKEGFSDVFAGVDATSPIGVALRYLIFPTTPYTAPLALPAPMPAKPVESIGKVRQELFAKFLNLDYSKLLPTASVQGDGVHSFFLAFPPLRDELQKALCLWLLECNPKCRVFWSRESGHWAHFVESSASGTVIVHETALSTVRRFPGLVKLLHGHNNAFTFWSFGELVREVDLLPVRGALGAAGAICTPELTRIFPHGNAVLVTPSFLVSEPQCVYQFFKWYRDYRVWQPSFYVVTSFHIVDYLRELAEEKAVERERLLQQPPSSERDVQEVAQGITKEDCDRRFRAWILIQDFILVNEQKADFLASEERFPLVLADAVIDPNDEQSLVNWFGWWSLSKLDSIRKFYVLGSGPSGEHRASRVVNIPEYSMRTVNDPDYLLRKAEEGSIPKKPLMDPAALQMKKQPDPQTDYVTGFTGFQSDRLKTGWPDELAYEMGNMYNKARRTWLPMIFYKWPVSYFGPIGMQDFFDDFKGIHFKTFTAWFSFFKPFESPEVQLKKGDRITHTYGGFFYTVDCEWDPRSIPPGKVPRRYPWLAFYRPIDLHNKPWRRTEIVIWDLSFKDKYHSQQEVSWKDLNHAQRSFLDTVADMSKEKNPEMTFERVWLWGFEPSVYHERYPVDGTLDFMEFMLGNMSRYLPTRTDVMEQSGFKLLTNREPNRKPFESAPPEAMDVDAEPEGNNSINDEDGNKDTRIIFHPPRGEPSAEGVNNRNMLYDAAEKVRRDDKDRLSFKYTYPPTVSWYKEQKADGRGYEHICVDSWENLFRVLKVDAPA